MSEYNIPRNFTEDVSIEEYRETIRSNDAVVAVDVVKRKEGWIVGIKNDGAWGHYDTKEKAVVEACKRAGVGDAVILHGIESDDAEVIAVNEQEPWSPGHGPADKSPTER